MVVAFKGRGCPFVARASFAQRPLELTSSRSVSRSSSIPAHHQPACISFMSWNSDRIQRLATAATITFFGLPARFSFAPNALHLACWRSSRCAAWKITIFKSAAPARINPLSATRSPLEQLRGVVHRTARVACRNRSDRSPRSPHASPTLSHARSQATSSAWLRLGRSE